jgi:hypothetical protein
MEAMLEAQNAVALLKQMQSHIFGSESIVRQPEAPVTPTKIDPRGRFNIPGLRY